MSMTTSNEKHNFIIPGMLSDHSNAEKDISNTTIKTNAYGRKQGGGVETFPAAS
jgi:hypothetical protein